ncbi:SMI1/KNR4 family protein [Marinobacter nanhaiticus D15-8W]|uniref:SMI1/KNR4 family protein n=1 Tax=Marinobacter nanhaiticus D15-8W TaxID=626887 RepID=N6X5X5_9GAMM|nr:SMI1/KNR4 family protein [Marinobacter nanhaiticus D15-8W]
MRRPQLGSRLDQAHRDFLAHVDGWRSFFQAVDVFGTKDLVAGTKHARAVVLLESLGDTRPLCGAKSAELLPFAASSIDIDVFAIGRSESEQPGVVYWFAGGLVEQFPSFEEWFLAMNDYNREEYEALRALS